MVKNQALAMAEKVYFLNKHPVQQHIAGRMDMLQRFWIGILSMISKQ